MRRVGDTSHAARGRRGRPDVGEFGATAETSKTHPRLFAPQDLGLLEPPDREAWQKPDQVMDALHIAEGTTVADIGAGGGWFTMRLARRVGPNGRVYAVDVQRLMIEAISRRIEREGLDKIVDAGAWRIRRPEAAAQRPPGCRAHRRRVPRDAGSGAAAQERRAHAQASGTHRHHRLPRRRRRARPRRRASACLRAS